MKRKTSREILADSFRELAKTKAIDRITIKDITDNCGYSPATFYRQFRDKYDLIAWDYATVQSKSLVIGYLEGQRYLTKAGGINGGFNFDSKNRRPSNTFEDMFHGYILGMDTFALGLIKAAALIEDGRLDANIKERYKSFSDTEIGKKIRNKETSLEELAGCASQMKKPAEPGSGRQELLEQIMNEVLFR